MPAGKNKRRRRIGAGGNDTDDTEDGGGGGFELCSSLADCTNRLIKELGIKTEVFQSAQWQMTSILSGIFGKALKLLGLMLGVLAFSGLPGVQNASKAVTNAARGVATRVRKAVKGIWDKAKSVGMKVFGPIFKKMRALFQKPAFVGAIATGMILLTYLKGCSAQESLDNYVKHEFSTSVGDHIKTMIEGIPSLPLVGSTLNSIASLIGTLVTAVIQSSQNIVRQVVHLMQNVCAGSSTSKSITDTPPHTVGSAIDETAGVDILRVASEENLFAFGISDVRKSLSQITINDTNQLAVHTYRGTIVKTLDNGRIENQFHIGYQKRLNDKFYNKKHDLEFIRTTLEPGSHVGISTSTSIQVAARYAKKISDPIPLET